MADKLLSISLLVSGREDTTEKCLRSLKRIRDELNTEIILVDTGCPDTWQKPLESRRRLCRLRFFRPYREAARLQCLKIY